MVKILIKKYSLEFLICFISLNPNYQEELMKKGLAVLVVLLLFIPVSYGGCGKCPGGVCERPEGDGETKTKLIQTPLNLPFQV